MPNLNPITVYSYGFLFNCTTVGQASDSLTANCEFAQLIHLSYSSDLAPSGYDLDREFGTMMSSRLIQRFGLVTKQPPFISKALSAQKKRAKYVEVKGYCIEK